MVRPQLEYGAPVWAPHGYGHLKQIDTIENIQMRATKMVPGMPSSYPERLRLLKKPTLAYRRERGDMIQVYKMLTGCYDKTLPQILEKNESHLRGHHFEFVAGKCF